MRGQARAWLRQGDPAGGTADSGSGRNGSVRREYLRVAYKGAQSLPWSPAGFPGPHWPGLKGPLRGRARASSANARSFSTTARNAVLVASFAGSRLTVDADRPIRAAATTPIRSVLRSPREPGERRTATPARGTANGDARKGDKLAGRAGRRCSAAASGCRTDSERAAHGTQPAPAP